MNRFAQAGAFALLLAASGLHLGCSNSSAGLTTGSNLLPGDAPVAAGLSNEDPMARPVGVAWTAARAKRCSFYFDPGKLRASYLSSESRQGVAGEHYAKVEKTYDTTYRVTLDKTMGDPDYCSERKGLEIKADLERHLAGDYTPNLPKAKPIASCGFWGCKSSQDEQFSSKKFWSEQEKNPRNK